MSDFYKQLGIVPPVPTEVFPNIVTKRFSIISFLKPAVAALVVLSLLWSRFGLGEKSVPLSPSFELALETEVVHFIESDLAVYDLLGDL